MAITNFIPTVWSENLLHSLDSKYIAVANCNREYEGEIKNKGAVVKICGVGSVDIADYTADTDMSNPQTLTDTVKELKIDRAKYFNFQIDDINRAQCSPKLMESAMRVAADSLANEADEYVFSMFRKAGKEIICDKLTKDNIFENLIQARMRLFSAGAVTADEVVIEVSPQVAGILIRSKLDLQKDNTALLEKGCLGTFQGCKIFISKNISKVANEAGDIVYHKCFMRTKRAIAFAEQLSEIEAYRPEKRFSDAVKGLHLYGAEVVYPNELVLLDLGLTKAESDM